MEYQKICRSRGKIDKACDVYISRAFAGAGWNLARSKWAVPHEISTLTGKALHDAYRAHVCEHLKNDLPELAFQKLGCWCKNEDTCHAKVLIDLLSQYAQQQTVSVLDAENPTLHVERVPLYRATKRKCAANARLVQPKQIEQLGETKQIEQLGETKQVAQFVQPIEKFEQVAQLGETKQIEQVAQLGETKQIEQVARLVQPKHSCPQETAKQRQQEMMEFEQLLFDTNPIALRYFVRNPMIITCRVNDEPLNGTDTIINRIRDDGIHVIYRAIPTLPPVAFDPTPFVHKRNGRTISVAKGLCKRLETNGDWEPFYCYVARITKHKKTERFQMILSETVSASSANENSIKVHLGSQISPLVSTRFVTKDDLIYVKHYAITSVGPRKKIVLLTCVEKVV